MQIIDIFRCSVANRKKKNQNQQQPKRTRNKLVVIVLGLAQTEMFPHTQPIKTDHFKLNKTFHSKRNKSDILSNTSQPESESMKKKGFVCLPLCTRGADPVALGSQRTHRHHSPARPGYVRQQGWVLWERAAVSSEPFSRRKEPTVAKTLCLDH